MDKEVRDPAQTFPGQGQVRPEQLEIEQLRREVTKLNAERDILNKGRSLLREGSDMKFVFIAKDRRGAGRIALEGPRQVSTIDYQD